MRKSRSFLPMLTASFFTLTALLCPLATSCNGNGGTSEMDGDIYTPFGGGYLEMVPTAAQRA